jgi:uncharacterized protein (DUF2267 family)
VAATGLEVFDKTLQTTNIWLDDIMAEIGPDRQLAWKVLSTVLHKLRDRMPVEAAAHLGAQLPLLVRGAYYDQYIPARQPNEVATIEEFCADVGKWLSDARPVDPTAAVRAVFAVLQKHLDPGMVTKVQVILPQSIRTFWQSMAPQREPAWAEE